MYSDKKSVLELVSLLKAHGITQIVLSPGSRNSPLIHSFATDNDFKCYSIVDERSAGFFALGVIQATGKPAAVCCTSGTATLNLAPAVAEAFYQELPLLVISADRPAEWIGQMEGQTIPQQNIFGKMVHHSVHLPEIKSNDDLWYCNRLINEAIISLDNGKKGPAHINIPLSEPLFAFNIETLPKPRVIRSSKLSYTFSNQENYIERFFSYAKKIIIVGQLPPQNNLSEILRKLSFEHNVVILTDHLSNVHIDENKRYDLLLRTASERELQELSPELLITIGGHTVSKRIKHFLRNCNIKEHWHISPSGEVTDTYQKVTDIVKCDYESFLKQISKSDNFIGDTSNRFSKTIKTAVEFKKLWSDSCTKFSLPEVEFSDLYTVGKLLRSLPDNISLHLANSNSIYLSQLFEVPDTVDCFSNRGTNGIEGSISTAVGYAAATERMTILLTGDLSFFYDMNAIWNRHISSNLRILINNNGGGGIFDTLPGLNSSAVLRDFISVTHTTSAKGWAEQQGFLYLSANNVEELHEHMPIFLNPDSRSPVILEVFTPIDSNSSQIKTYYKQQ